MIILSHKHDLLANVDVDGRFVEDSGRSVVNGCNE
jgi:hypothetical protein